jgi:hypothetical protein
MIVSKVRRILGSSVKHCVGANQRSKGADDQATEGVASESADETHGAAHVLRLLFGRRLLQEAAVSVAW